MRGVRLVSGRWRALKIISRHAYSHQRELDLLSRLQHPNIIPLLQTLGLQRQSQDGPASVVGIPERGSCVAGASLSPLLGLTEGGGQWPASSCRLAEILARARPPDGREPGAASGWRAPATLLGRVLRRDAFSGLGRRPWRWGRQHSAQFAVGCRTRASTGARRSGGAPSRECLGASWRVHMSGSKELERLQCSAAP